LAAALPGRGAAGGRAVRPGAANAVSSGTGVSRASHGTIRASWAHASCTGSAGSVNVSPARIRSYREPSGVHRISRQQEAPGGGPGASPRSCYGQLKNPGVRSVTGDVQPMTFQISFGWSFSGNASSDGPWPPRASRTNGWLNRFPDSALLASTYPPSAGIGDQVWKWLAKFATPAMPVVAAW